MTNEKLTVQTIEKWCVVELRTPSLMDPLEIKAIGDSIFHLVDVQDKRLIILDFEQVEYLSSQAIGIVITLYKKLSALKNSKLVLCGVSAKLQELLRITRLDKLLTIKPTQREALKVLPKI